MKTATLNTGGRPFKNEDINLFIQVLALIESLCEDIGNNVMIVSGCETVTAPSGPPTYNDGYIYLGGEIVKFSVPTPQATPFNLEIVTTEGDPRTYFDGAVKNSTTDSVANYTAGAGFVFNGDSTPRLTDYLNTTTEVETAISPSVVADVQANLLDSQIRKVLNIGVWDMTSANFKDVPHGLSATEYLTVTDVQVMIQNDSQSALYDLSAIGSGVPSGDVLVVGAVNVELRRIAGEIFDTVDFDDVGVNRGYVSFFYTPD